MSDILDETLNNLMEYSFKYGKGEIPISENPPLLVAREAKQALQSYIDTKVIEGRLEEAGLFKQYFKGRTQAYANTRIEVLEAELKLKGEK